MRDYRCVSLRTLDIAMGPAWKMASPMVLSARRRVWVPGGHTVALLVNPIRGSAGSGAGAMTSPAQDRFLGLRWIGVTQRLVIISLYIWVRATGRFAIISRLLWVTANVRTAISWRLLWFGAPGCVSNAAHLYARFFERRM